MDTTYRQNKIAAILSRLLPRRAAYRLGRYAADHVYARDTVGRTAVKSNLRRILAFSGQNPSEDELDAMARETFRNFSKQVVDFLGPLRISRGEVERRVRIEHLEYVDEALAGGRGALLVTAHLGAWELGAAVLAALGYALSAVALPQKDARLNELFQERRRRRGTDVIPLGHAVPAIIRSLDAGRLVALLADRNYTNQSIEAPFFGAPARFPRGPAVLCVKRRVPIVPGFMIRNDDNSYLLRIHPPIVPGSGDSADSVQRALCAVLEQGIARHPTQWLFFRDFWAAQ